MILPISYYGDPILRTKTELITTFDKELKSLVKNMIETMHAEDGAGLAAPQVGEARRIFVIDPDFNRRNADFHCTIDGKIVPPKLIFPFVAINAEIEELREPNVVYNEGCLSFRYVRFDIERPHFLRMKYQDIDGNPHVVETDGSFARIILHEYDHVEGILFIDRVDRQTLKRSESKLKRLKRETRDMLKKKNHNT
ncbi:MAG TPA: peptide deformylase [Opitutae bacterium]|nr:peptide deformylase [Opitutae bacterium]|tara:strand:- start:854 stop:1441 length:588 start_codon:yes stop_codon:yes gene_type:complete